MDFAAWLRRWLERHPVKDVEVDRSRYTAHVMERIRAEQEAPRAAWSLPSFTLPRLAFAGAGALVAAGLALLFIVRAPSGRMASANLDPQVVEALALIGAVEGEESLVLDELGTEDLELLVEALDEMDLIVLAEDTTIASEDQWLEQTLYLLEQFDEEVPDEGLERNEEDWLREFQLVDETDLTAKL